MPPLSVFFAKAAQPAPSPSPYLFPGSLLLFETKIFHVILSIPSSFSFHLPRHKKISFMTILVYLTQISRSFLGKKEIGEFHRSRMALADTPPPPISTLNFQNSPVNIAPLPTEIKNVSTTFPRTLIFELYNPQYQKWCSLGDRCKTRRRRKTLELQIKSVNKRLKRL